MNEQITMAVISVVGLIVGKDAFWEWFRSRKLSTKDRLILAIGRERLLISAKKYIKDGKIPADEYDMFVEMGESYIAMGGNHVTKRLFLQAKELPVVDDDE